MLAPTLLALVSNLPQHEEAGIVLFLLMAAGNIHATNGKKFQNRKLQEK